VSVEWLLKLHALNEAGRFDEVVRQAKLILESRPRDYAVRLQVGRALVALGELKRAKTELLASVKHSKGLAAWPWFYLAALHARSGAKVEMTSALNRALAIDPKIESSIRNTPWFAAYIPLHRGETLAKRAGARKTIKRKRPTPRSTASVGEIDAPLSSVRRERARKTGKRPVKKKATRRVRAK
jgi:predicted Zn-dependent protease